MNQHQSIYPGYFITLEGGDGAGKTTLITKIEAYFKTLKLDYILTREPGGPEISEEIRTIILKPGRTMSALTELFLYEASRAEHVEKLIIPKLKSGSIVICDRFTESSIAYQGYGRNIGKEIVEQLNYIATGGLKPDVVIYLELEPSEAQKRIKSRGDSNRLDSESENFKNRVHQGYLDISRQSNVIKLDASRDPETIFNELITHSLWKNKLNKKKVLLFNNKCSIILI
jgi:dTMP kinase